MAGTAGSYELGRFTGVCASNGCSIPAGERFTAALVDRVADDGSAHLARADYSREAWESGARPNGLVCFWQSVAPHPGERRQMFVDDETLLEMVQREDPGADDRRRAFRWILALVMLRRKALRLVGVERDGSAEAWKFLPRGAPPEMTPICIENPRIKDEAMRDLADQLAEVIRPDGG
jgi:hypothetical protein